MTEIILSEDSFPIDVQPDFTQFPLNYEVPHRYEVPMRSAVEDILVSRSHDISAAQAICLHHGYHTWTRLLGCHGYHA